MARPNRPLRSGYTTGACAAAAAKAAAMQLTGIPLGESVDIPMPSGERATFKIHSQGMEDAVSRASVIKDAGDDPDVTNGAEIEAMAAHSNNGIIIKGGVGVGVVTRPGLPVKIGESAINPVPMAMIREAVSEVASSMEITICVPRGEELALKTLNSRLGIVGGISILGTTGIVRPLSSEAWTATIRSSMDVARASGLDEIVLSAGRTSELAHMRTYNLPEPSYVMMGDYVEFSLKEAASHGFKIIHLAAQWAKMLKIAMATPDTHVRAGVIDMKQAAGFLDRLGIRLSGKDYNTAREMLDEIEGPGPVLRMAEWYCSSVSGIPTRAHLVSYDGRITNA